MHHGSRPGPRPGSELGDWLRTLRERLRPADVGLTPGERRRVPGLRREEVAHLAGISTEYYLRLERGRDRRPSAQVVDSLARALLLTEDEERHLRRLAAPRPGPRHRPEGQGGAAPGTAALIDQWTTTPALVQGPSMETLAANPAAVALNPCFKPGGNSLKAVFTEPGMRRFYRDWDAVTAKAVAYLRSLTGPESHHDPALVALIGELSLHSERFRTLWARKDVRRATRGVSLMRHPLVGDLDLRFQKFSLPGTGGQTLVTYHADPGSTSYERLLLLAGLPGPRAPRPRPAHGNRRESAHER
ncbi:helix-turn-helix domain-containing protein [Streptomyces sp. NPDC049879]|uniref:helix-turn-helix domain-containing protein n=1 Tax=Streptomyces sp. NPDC049879 TaxID=3365598 RepID=UPI003793C177